MATLALLVTGGAAGTLARYVFSLGVYRVCGAGFPYGTLAVNLTGCFVMGVLVALSEGKFALGSQARILLMIGFCGAFTTFSTFIFETSQLIRDGETWRALLNVLVSVIVGFAVFRIGMLIGEVI